MSCFLDDADSPKHGSGPVNGVAEPLLASSSAISFPGMSEWPGTQTILTLLLEARLFSVD